MWMMDDTNAQQSNAKPTNLLEWNMVMNEIPGKMQNEQFP